MCRFDYETKKKWCLDYKNLAKMVLVLLNGLKFYKLQINLLWLINDFDFNNKMGLFKDSSKDSNDEKCGVRQIHLCYIYAIF